MLPGVELARRRRVHYHGDVASSSAEHHYYAHGHHAAPAPTGVAGPALAARIRLEEKLRGAALPPTSPSRWSRLRATPSTRRRDEQQDVVPATGAEPGPESWRPPAPDPAALLQAAAADMPASTRRQRRAELTRTLSKVDVCAVCLDEVREERRQRVTRLPCSHKYHSECVLPWLAIHPDCPSCRALVPSADALVHQV
ncbi:uncharacterized protein [Miscanthus floridulus]|uniref:uncharacterized protein n=1 Tax=Miscanthus floridulus TaxID=154761 RepID=UPI0034574619